MTAIYITAAVLAFIMLILLIPVDCIIDFSYNKDKNRGYIILSYAFLKIKILPTEKKIEKAAKDTEEEAEKEVPKKDRQSVEGTVKFAEEVYAELKDDIKNLISHFFKKTLRVKELNISSKFGTGDAMYTGIITGGLNGFVYNVISAVDRHMQLDKWNVSLEPDFDNSCLAAGVYCKIRTRCVYVINLGIMAVILLLKILKIKRRMSKDGGK